MGKVDAYLCNVISSEYREVLDGIRLVEKKKGKPFPHGAEFLALDQARALADKFKLEAYGVVPMGSFCSQVGHYFVGPGKVVPHVDRDDPEWLLQFMNQSLTEAKSLKPENERQFYMVAGDYMGKMADTVAYMADRFDGLKIGVARSTSPIGPNSERLWDCVDELNQGDGYFPVNYHASLDERANGINDFPAILKVHQEYPDIPIMVGHMGGDPKENDAQVFVDHAEKIVDTNLMVNYAVRDLSSLEPALDRFPQLVNHLVRSGDVPFCAGRSDEVREQDVIYRETLRRESVFQKEALAVIDENSRRFLLG